MFSFKMFSDRGRGRGWHQTKSEHCRIQVFLSACGEEETPLDRKQCMHTYIIVLGKIHGPVF